MKFQGLKTEDIIEENGLAEYKAGMEFFYSQLVELNTIIYLAEKIIEFPFEIFAPHDKTIFFSVVMRSFYDSAILIITRLATDQKGDLYTLRRFKNRVRELVKSEYKADFDDNLNNARFNKSLEQLFEKARHLRLNRIAHTTNQYVQGKIVLSKLNINELKELRDALNFLLDRISFNTEHIMLPVPYDTKFVQRQKSNETTDIEELLDSIAKNSNILNMPEKHPERWQYRITKLSAEKLRKINQYRLKFGMPEV